MSLLVSQGLTVTDTATGGAAGIALTENVGATDTIVLTNTQGTGENAITLTATAGGIDLNAAPGKDITADAGQILITSSQSTVNAIYLHADGGLAETITIHADQGTSATAGAASVQVTSDVGGVGVLSGLDAADAIYLHANGGTGEKIRIHSDQGTGVDSIELVSDAGGVEVNSGLGTVNAIHLDALSGNAAAGINVDCGTSGFDLDSTGEVNVASSKNGASALVLTASAGGIDITATGAAAGEDINITATGSSVNITATENAADAIYLLANGGTGEKIRIRAAQGTGVDSIELVSDAGGVEVNSGLGTVNAIHLDALSGNAAAGINVDCGTSGFDLDSTGEVNIASSKNGASALVLTASAGGIDITATNAAASEDINITATGSSVNITATENAADAIYLLANGGTGEKIRIRAAQGTGADSIELVSVAGGVEINGGVGSVNAIHLDALSGNAAAGINVDCGTSGFDLDSTGEVNIASSKNGASALVLTASAGGIDITATGAAAGEDINITATGSSVNISATENAASAITLLANGGTSETIVIRADQGTGAGSIQLTSDDGGITMSTGSGKSVVVDALQVGVDQGTALAGAKTLTLSDSGSVFKFDDTNLGYTITLPAVTSATIGAEFTFVLEDTSGGGNVTIDASANQDFLGAILHDAGAATNFVAANGTVDRLTIDEDNAVGSWVRVKCISTTTPMWFIEGMVSGTAPAFSAQ